MSVDIILVNPSDRKQTYGQLATSLAGAEPPLWHALLAAGLRDKGFSVAIIDADVEGLGPEDCVDKILEYEPLLVGIGAVGSNPSASSTPKMTAVHAVLDELKKRSKDTKTVIYGIHPSGLPEKTFKEEEIDFLCQGEAFIPVAQLLEKLKNGKSNEDYHIKGLWYRKGKEIVDGGWAEVVENLDDLPMAAWDLLPMEKYKAHNWHSFGHIDKRSPYGIIFTSLGCPFNCHYCNIHAMYSGKPGIRFRSSKKVIEEIDYLVKTFKIHNLKFLDELFVLNPERLIELCDMLIERKYDLNIWAYARIDTINDKILEKLKKAGVRWLCYGIEAGSQNVRMGVNKGRFDKETIQKTIKMTQDAGIYILGNFMFGLPDDTLETMQETFDLAKSLKCEYVNFYTTMAYPGSQLYDEMLEKGIAFPESWKGFSQYSAETLPLPTKHISAKEVLAFRDKAFHEYLSDPEYQESVKEKFGEKTLKHLQELLKNKLKRNILMS